jgi:hypothetical protein
MGCSLARPVRDWTPLNRDLGPIFRATDKPKDKPLTQTTFLPRGLDFDRADTIVVIPLPGLQLKRVASANFIVVIRGRGNSHPYHLHSRRDSLSSSSRLCI